MTYEELMDEKTLTALQGSIKKWEAIVNGTGVDNGLENCPLCQEFADEEHENWEDGDGCFGCPVSLKTGLSGCGGSPYEQWAEYGYAHGQQFVPRTVFDERSKELAQAELDFLRSLAV